MNKIIRFFSIAMLFCIPSVASAQYFMSGGIGYQVLSAEDHTVEVSIKSNCSPYSGNINIPPTVVSNGVTYDVVALGESAFSQARLTGVTIPSSVTQIKSSCFVFATCPRVINIPASVVEIGGAAFAASNLTTLNVDENNPNYMFMDGMLFSKDTTTLVECLLSKSGTVALPQATKHIAERAFGYCQSITSVTLPEGLESIGFYAFMSNSNLNNVVIPSSVSFIDGCPFANCTRLNNLSIAEGNTHYYMDGMMIYSMGGDSLVSAHKSADSVFLPSTLHYVTGFAANNDVRYVSVPDGVTAISPNAFCYSSLEGIDLPSQMQSIGAWAFEFCEALRRVAMPASLDTLGQACFEGCALLEAVDIPNGLRSIPVEAFLGCSSLSAITLGDAVEVIDTAAFGGCSVTELLFPSTLRSIRMDAFVSYNYVGNMRSVVFNAPVDTLEPESFSQRHIGLLRLKNMVPPVSCTLPEYGADYGCLYLSDVDSIIIPCGSLNAYLTDSYWGLFADKYHEDCNGIDEADADDWSICPAGDCVAIRGAQGEAVYVFDVMGRQLYHTASAAEEVTVRVPCSGVYIVKVGGSPAKKITIIQ